MPTYQPPPFPMPYGNAPRSSEPWWPNVNLEGRQLVQPQPNPYFAHWPQQMGQTDTSRALSAGAGLTVVLLASLLSAPMFAGAVAGRTYAKRERRSVLGWATAGAAAGTAVTVVLLMMSGTTYSVRGPVYETAPVGS